MCDVEWVLFHYLRGEALKRVGAFMVGGGPVSVPFMPWL